MAAISVPADINRYSRLSTLLTSNESTSDAHEFSSSYLDPEHAPHGATPTLSSLEAGRIAATPGITTRSWPQRIGRHLVDELKSVSRLQWIIMIVAAVIVVPWTYKAWRLAQWTARLDYLQECRKSLVRLLFNQAQLCKISHIYERRTNSPATQSVIVSTF